MVGVGDGEDAGDGFAEVVAVRELRQLPYSFPQLQDLVLNSADGVLLLKGSYILVSFEAAPPAIFCTRSWPSSVFSSSSCFLRSSRLLPHSWPAFILAVDIFLVAGDCLLASVVVLAQRIARRIPECALTLNDGKRNPLSQNQNPRSLGLARW